MSEETAVMETATSPWPDNLDTATQLVIQSPCMVPDVYQLICDRRNIKKVNVAGHEYSSQEIRCTSFAERLGGGPTIDVPIPVTEPTPFTRALRGADPVPGAPADPVRAHEGQWAYPQQTGQMYNTTGIYEQYIQNRPRTARDRVTGPPIIEDPIRGLQESIAYFDAISPADSYF